MFFARRRPTRAKIIAAIAVSRHDDSVADEDLPGSVIASSRAATFTPSPYISPLSSMTSPRLMPMRSLNGPLSKPCWMARAASTASLTLGNSRGSRPRSS